MQYVSPLTGSMSRKMAEGWQGISAFCEILIHDDSTSSATLWIDLTTKPQIHIDISKIMVYDLSSLANLNLFWAKIVGRENISTPAHVECYKVYR